MGAVKSDLHAKERSLDANYPALNNPLGLRILLGDWHALRLRRFNGDTAASDILIDLETAIERAGLTNRQRQALTLVYFEDLTQEEAGKRMGLARESVKTYVENALDKIAEIYWYWSGHGEGYSLITTTEEMTI